MDELQYVDANGLRIACIGAGDPKAPLALMVHGFPDTPHTWEHALGPVAELGFRVIAPFTRGYAPTTVPANESYDADTLGRDVLALATALGAEKLVLIGHDWGAAAAYSAAGMASERLRLLITVGLPHPASLMPTPRMVWAVRHFFYLRRRRAAAEIRAGNFAYLDELVARWSPAWKVPPGETDAVKRSLSQAGSLEAALGYYRALRPGVPASQRKPVACPTVAFAGTDDNVPVGIYERARRCFAGSYEIVTMPGGHFMHREHPETFGRELTRVLAPYAS